MLPCALRLRTSPPYSGRLWRCHMSYSSGTRLPAWEGSDAAMCPVTLDPTSLLRRAPALPHVPWPSALGIMKRLAGLGM
jgi:hypothetical protein